MARVRGSGEAQNPTASPGLPAIRKSTLLDIYANKYIALTPAERKAWIEQKLEDGFTALVEYCHKQFDLHHQRIGKKAAKLAERNSRIERCNLGLPERTRRTQRLDSSREEISRPSRPVYSGAGEGQPPRKIRRVESASGTSCAADGRNLPSLTSKEPSHKPSDHDRMRATVARSDKDEAEFDEAALQLDDMLGAALRAYGGEEEEEAKSTALQLNSERLTISGTVNTPLKWHLNLGVEANVGTALVPIDIEEEHVAAASDSPLTEAVLASRKQLKERGREVIEGNWRADLERRAVLLHSHLSVASEPIRPFRPFAYDKTSC